METDKTDERADAVLGALIEEYVEALLAEHSWADVETDGARQRMQRAIGARDALAHVAEALGIVDLDRRATDALTQRLGDGHQPF